MFDKSIVYSVLRPSAITRKEPIPLWLVRILNLEFIALSRAKNNDKMDPAHLLYPAYLLSDTASENPSIFAIYKTARTTIT